MSKYESNGYFPTINTALWKTISLAYKWKNDNWNGNWNGQMKVANMTVIELQRWWQWQKWNICLAKNWIKYLMVSSVLYNLKLNKYLKAFKFVYNLYWQTSPLVESPCNHGCQADNQGCESIMLLVYAYNKLNFLTNHHHADALQNIHLIPAA